MNNIDNFVCLDPDDYLFNYFGVSDAVSQPSNYVLMNDSIKYVKFPRKTVQFSVIISEAFLQISIHLYSIYDYPNSMPDIVSLCKIWIYSESTEIIQQYRDYGQRQ